MQLPLQLPWRGANIESLQQLKDCANHVGPKETASSELLGILLCSYPSLLPAVNTGSLGDVRVPDRRYGSGQFWAEPPSEVVRWIDVSQLS